MLTCSLPVLSGWVGFNKDMGALDGLVIENQPPDSDKADILLRSTHEVMQRIHEPWRQHKLYRSDVRAGYAVLAKFRVRLTALCQCTSNQPVDQASESNMAYGC